MERVELDKYKTVSESLNFALVELQKKVRQMEDEKIKYDENEKNKQSTIDILGKIITERTLECDQLKRSIEDIMLNLSTAERKIAVS